MKSQAAEVLRQEIIARKLATIDQLDGELTIPFMNGCHSKVNQYLSLVRPDDVENAYNKPERIEAGRAELERARAKKFWQNPDADSEHRQEYGAAGDLFADTHPAFIQIRSNLQEMGLELSRQNLNPSLDNLNKVYRDLALAGRLTLAIENHPSAPADAPAEALGVVLQRWIKQIPSLLEPVKLLSDEDKEKQRVASLSADSYAAEFLQKDETPALILRRIESDIREFCSNHPNYDPTPDGREILLSWIRGQGLHVCHDSLEASWAANQEHLHAANCIFDSGPSIPVRYNASTLIDHRKPAIPAIERPITLEPSPTVKRVDMDKLLALPAAEFQRVVNGTPGLRALLDGE